MTCSGPGAAARQSRDWAQVCPTPGALSFTLCPLYSFRDSEILAPHEVLIPTCPSLRPHGRATLHVQPQPIRADPRPDQMLRSWRCLSDQECSSNKAQPGRSFPSGPYYPPHHTRHACLGFGGAQEEAPGGERVEEAPSAVLAQSGVPEGVGEPGTGDMTKKGAEG